MSIKSEIKISLLHDQGVKIEDKLEEAYKRQAAYDGAKQALRLISKNIAVLSSVADKDRDEGRLSFEDDTKALSYIKTMVDRAVNMALSASQHQESLQLSVGGEITAYKSMADSLHKEINVEKSKLKAFNDAIQAGNIVLEDGSATQSEGSTPLSRITGVRPGAGIAAQRKAESIEEAKVSQEEGGEDLASDSSDLPDEKNDDSSQVEKKKRGRKKSD